MASPSKGSIKKKKLARKAKELSDRYIREFNDQVGRLEDRDTQQSAFLALIESLPHLDPSRVGEVYTLIEKNKRPTRSSTRRMLVLLVAVLCRYHPVSMAKLLPRALAYISIRLRDSEARVTDACAVLVSAISMHVLASVSSGDSTEGLSAGSDKASKAFEQVAASLLKDANAVSEGVARCMCSLILPTEFDGVSRPPVETIVAHAKRVLPFLRRFLAEMVAKMDGSTNYAGFSPFFLQLHAVCALATESHRAGGFSDVKEAIDSLVESIFEAMEDAFKYGPRDDWVLRKRAIELFALLLEAFALRDEHVEGAVGAAGQYFRDNLERCRALVVAARHDPVSSVRDAAIAAARVFDELQKQCPMSAASKPTLNLLLNPSPSQSSDFGRSQPPQSRLRVDETHEGSRGRADLCPEAQPWNVSPHGDEEGDQGGAEFGEDAGDEAAGPETEAAHHQAEEAAGPGTPAVDAALMEPIPTESPSKEESASTAALANMLTAKQPSIRARRTHGESIPRVSVPKAKKTPQRARFSPSFEPLPDGMPAEVQGDRADEDGSEPSTYAEAALTASKRGESELALRLCLAADDLSLLRQTLPLLGRPCLASLSRVSRSAVCMALLALLDGCDGSHPDDAWLALEWLESLVDAHRSTTREVDPRVRHALTEQLSEMSYEPTRLALGAARVLERLRLS